MDAQKAVASRWAYSFRAGIVRHSGSYWVEVPARVSRAIGLSGRVPVVARIGAGHEFHGTLMPRGGGGHRLMVNSTARSGARSGKLAVTVRIADAEREVAIPEDLATALEEAGARAGWESLPPGKREHILAWIDQAAHEATRVKRIVLAVEKAEERREKLADRGRRR
jgi:hypothetical protein